MDELRNYVVFLSGGVGSRMKTYSNCPKQYIEVNGKPIFLYSLMTIEKCKDIHGIVIVADERWHGVYEEEIEQSNITKVLGFAEPGKSRQGSILSGLRKLSEIAGKEDIVIIHDAARPMVSEKLLEECIMNNKNCDGIMPCIELKDTVYESYDGKNVSKLLDRRTLYAGQAPESFVFGKYYNAYLKYTEDELEKFSGSTQIATDNGMDICIIQGEENNFKITTIEDLEHFKYMVQKRDVNG